MIEALKNHRIRGFHIMVFLIIFLVGGQFLPYVYFRFFDQTKYIEYLDPVSFDKKIYKPCEDQVALSHIKILIDAPVVIESRLYLIRSKPDNQYEVVKEYHFNTFFKKTADPQELLSTQPLPCTLKAGIYFYRGILSYQIKGIDKTSPIISEEFTVMP